MEVEIRFCHKKNIGMEWRLKLGYDFPLDACASIVQGLMQNEDVYDVQSRQGADNWVTEKAYA